MQANSRTTTTQLDDFHLAPGNTMDASTERLTDSFFGSKAPGKPCCLATTLPHLCFCENPLQKTLTMVLEDLAHAVNFDDIDTNSNIHTLWGTQWRRQTCHSSRPKQPIRNGLSRLAYQRRKQKG